MSAHSLSGGSLVIGGGVVGLAIGARLSRGLNQRPVFVVERHSKVGQETSSRNSEVIHAGLYYPPDSLKTKLCIQGRKLLYNYCDTHQVRYKKCGKLILATTIAQQTYLDGLHRHAAKIGVPLHSLSPQKTCEMEPDLSTKLYGSMFSPETGIISSHDFMASLEQEIIDSDQGQVILGTKVIRIDKAEGGSGKGRRGDGSDVGWLVQLEIGGERDSILCGTVINAAGLSSHYIANMALPGTNQELLYAKGSYFGYRGQGVNNVKHLLYPCPTEGLSGLGTHLTFDLEGQIRFGPDVEWIEPSKEIDYWQNHLQPSEHRMQEAFDQVRLYLPNVKFEGFSLDYSGIRPKLGKGWNDFSITHPQYGFINVQGIESPGLTSSLAIARMVERLLQNEVWRGSGKYGISDAGNIEEQWD